MNKNLKITLKGPFGTVTTTECTAKEFELVNNSASVGYDKDDEDPTFFVSGDSFKKLKKHCEYLQTENEVPFAKPKKTPINSHLRRNSPRRHSLKTTLGPALPKAKVRNAVQDANSHYMDGLARLQMEMPDSAILHFQKAMNCGKNRVSCLLMIALCHIKKSNFGEAIRCLESGLAVEGITETETIALNYRLSQCLEAPGHDEITTENYLQARTLNTNNQSLNEKFITLERRLKKIEQRNTPIENVIPSLKNTDPPVCYDALEAPKHKPVAMWIAASIAVIGTFYLVSYFAVPSKTPERGENSIKMAASDVFAGQRTTVLSSVSVTEKPPGLNSSMKADVQTKELSFAKGLPILIAGGSVVNLTGDDGFGVVVQGKLLDKDGNLLSATTAPCGKVIDYARINQTHPKEVQSLYGVQSLNGKNENLFSCSIKKGERKQYQLVFDGIPKDLGNDFSVEVHAEATHLEPSVPKD